MEHSKLPGKAEYVRLAPRFGARLRRARQAAGADYITMSEALSAWMGVDFPVATYVEIENEHRLCACEFIDFLAALLDCDVEALIGNPKLEPW